MRRRWLIIRGKLAAMTDMILGPCESVHFREDVYVLENPRPITGRVCTSIDSYDVTLIPKGYSWSLHVTLIVLDESNGVQQVDFRPSWS